MADWGKFVLIFLRWFSLKNFEDDFTILIDVLQIYTNIGNFVSIVLFKKYSHSTVCVFS